MMITKIFFYSIFGFDKIFTKNVSSLILYVFFTSQKLNSVQQAFREFENRNCRMAFGNICINEDKKGYRCNKKLFNNNRWKTQKEI